MARGKGNSNGGDAVAPSAQPPRDTMVRLGSTSNAPWWNLRNGNRLHGRLLGVFERPDERSPSGKSKFFQIELLEATEVRSGRGEDAEVIQAEAGEVINLNHNAKTRDLEPLIDKILLGAVYEVACIVNGEKFNIGKGKSMWPIEVFAECMRGPRADAEPDFEEDSEEASQAAS